MLLAARPHMIVHGALVNPSLTTSTVVATVPASSSSSSSTGPPPPLPVSTLQRQRRPPAQRAQTIENTLLSDEQNAQRMQERMLAAQLAYLASQHHQSEYNRLKFGPAGCSAPYVPMSIQLRDQVKHLQARQAIYSRQKAWWPSDGRAQQQQQQQLPSSDITSVAPGPPQPLMVLQRPEAVCRADIPQHQLPSMASPQALNLQQELSAAMSSEIPSSSAVISFQQFHVTKTSESHPINITMVIPFEFLSTLQSQLHVAPKTSPCLFQLPRSYHMDFATLIPPPGAHTCASVYQFRGGTFSNSNAHGPMRTRTPQQPVLQVQNGIVGFGRVHSMHPSPPVFWNQQHPSGEELLKMALDETDNSKKTSSENAVTNHSRPQICAPPPPFVVPSQSHFAPPRVLTESPPVPVTPVAFQLPLYPSFSVSNPQGTSESEKKLPCSGVIRRPRHVRASSAPPTFGFGQGQSLREGRQRALQRNKSNLDVPSAWNPPIGHAPRPSTGILSSSKSFLTSSPAPRLLPLAGSLSTPAPNPPLTPPSSFETSLTENPAHLKASPLQTSLSAPPALTNNIHPVPTPGRNPIQCFHAPPPPAVTKLGNLFLSSCPGKKVRLTGPVKGRGSVCRDLRQDLARIRDLGVKCIICCLDDAELSYLGSPWSQYRAIASELGLDVLRLPTPEGLHPLSAEQLDKELERVIRENTLRGTPVLAHCRGGVGRAGLVACCWMLKLGLCGWKEQGVCRCWRCVAPASTPTATPAGQDSSLPLCYGTMHLLEKVIGVVRRRRSLKAIETFEQVKFLVDFIEYLDAKARAGSSSVVNTEGEGR